VVENAEELRRTVNFRRVCSEYDGFDHRLSNGRYRRILLKKSVEGRSRL